MVEREEEKKKLKQYRTQMKCEKRKIPEKGCWKKNYKTTVTNIYLLVWIRLWKKKYEELDFGRIPSKAPRETVTNSYTFNEIWKKKNCEIKSKNFWQWSTKEKQILSLENGFAFSTFVLACATHLKDK